MGEAFFALTRATQKFGSIIRELPAPRRVLRSVEPTMTEIHELRPARPDIDDKGDQGYMPKLPWKWIVGLLLFVGGSFAFYRAREQQEIDELRASIQASYQAQLKPLATRQEALLDKVYSHTLGAAAHGAPATYVDPRLNIDALHKGKGLYLRIEAKDATSKERIASASQDVFPDAIGKCLGLSPMLASELFARGSFLDQSWFRQVEEADGVMRLRVLAEEIRQRSGRDLPFVAEALESEWFLLVLQRGENRRDAPVDVYLWDLRKDQLLLSSRIKAEGALVSARIVVEGVKPGHYPSGAQTGAAQDCSIASQMRALTGRSPTVFTKDPPNPRAAIEGSQTPDEPAKQEGDAPPEAPAREGDAKAQ